MRITDYTGGYAIARFEQLRTGAFTAQIHRNGKHVIEVENDGRGGCNRYDAVSDESNAELRAFRDHAAQDFGDFEPADAFVDVLIDIALIQNLTRHNGTTFTQETEAMITDFDENGIPETAPYMQPHYDLLRKIGAAYDVEAPPAGAVDAPQSERGTDTSGLSSSTRAGNTASVRRTMFGR